MFLYPKRHTNSQESQFDQQSANAHTKQDPYHVPSNNAKTKEWSAYHNTWNSTEVEDIQD